MPVTARLSKRFYDVFGEEIATELVDWFNAVDATSRADLRELNELNFVRFDAKLEQYCNYVKAVVAEDKLALESLQRAAASGRYRPGPLAQLEVMLHHWLSHYARTMQG